VEIDGATVWKVGPTRASKDWPDFPLDSSGYRA